MVGVDLQVVQQVAELGGWLAEGGVVVLSGAGLSTDSGIPDYRGPSGSARRGTPMTYQAFTRDPVARRRYWARSHLGWRTIGEAWRKPVGEERKLAGRDVLELEGQHIARRLEAAERERVGERRDGRLGSDLGGDAVSLGRIDVRAIAELRGRVVLQH